MDEEFAYAPPDLEASDDEADEYKHAKLLQAIRKLDGKRRTGDIQRTEPIEKASEFHLAPGSGKVGLKDLVGALQRTTGHLEVKKQLNRVESRQRRLTTPLPTNELNKIERSIAYDATKEVVTKWDPIVIKNRRAEQLEFPLVKPAVQLRTTKQMTKGYKPRTPLEIEIAKMLSGNENVGTDKKELTPAEERALEAMSIDEARERRAELKKHRFLMSYKEAKARRQKKIKSKKYHRILRKEREKTEKKTLEELQRKDPEAYADRLLKLQKDRIEERMTLKHRGGSKFMKRQQLYGKFDEKTRQSTADMLELNKELTQKVDVESSSSDGEEKAESDEDDDQPARFTPSGQLVTSTTNPWMITVKPDNKGHHQLETVVNNLDDVDEGEKSNGEEEDNQPDEQGSEESQSEEENNDSVSNLNIDEIFMDAEKNINKKIKLNQAKEAERKKQLTEKRREARTRKRKGSVAKPVIKKKNRCDDSSEADSDDSDSEEEEMLVSRHSQDKASLKIDTSDTGLSNSLTRKRTLEDFDGDASDDEQQERKQSDNRVNEPDSTQKQSKHVEPQVDPKKYLTVDTVLTSGSAPDLIEGSGETAEDTVDQQKLTIAQAFAMDDVVQEFKQDKLAVAERDKPKDINLTLPGWGEWGGTGIKISKRKKKRFIIKAPTNIQRKDRDLNGVIISEAKDVSISKHQVKRIPYPFTNTEQFEASLRAPIGKTWNTENAYRKLIEPKIVTKMGTVIDPIDKAHVFNKQGAEQLGKNNPTQSKSDNKWRNKPKHK